MGVRTALADGLSFHGVVLCGGQSRRMGQDKALIEIGGRAMARIAADALLGAGASSICAIGGDAAALARWDLPVVADQYPGEGPLGALLSAFGGLCPLPDHRGAPASSNALIMVLTCDLPHVDAAVLTPVLSALRARPDAAVAAPILGGRVQLLSAAYRPMLVREAAQQAFDRGERSVRAALAGLVVTEVTLAPTHRWRLDDADTPDRLPAQAGLDDRSAELSGWQR